MKKTKFLIIIPILGYAVGIMLDAFLFLPLFLLTLYLAILYVVLFALLKKAMLRSSQVEFKKKEGIYKITVFIYSVCLFFGLWAINKYLLPHKLHMLSLATDAVLVGLTLFLGFCIAKQKSARDVLAGVVIFIILFCLAVAPGALTPRYVETSSFEALKSLPYLTWVPAKEGINKKGVTINKHELSYWGLNLFSYDGESEAYLMDSLGNVVHSWSGTSGAWHHVELCSDGALLVVTEDRALLKLDFNSNIVWMNDDRRFHHDISISENGDIYTLARKERFVLKHGVPFPVLDDYIVILSGAGEIEKEISLYELLKEDVSFGTIFKIYAWMARPNILMELILNKMDKGYAFLGWIGCAGDIFHANTVGVIGSETNGLTKEGYLLVCARNLDLVGILDFVEERFVFKWGPGDLRMPHHPTVLHNGNILVFDNGWERKYSRVVELDPVTKRIVWEYKRKDFFSLKRGASQRLKNGNTLITESDKGRVFEITPDGVIVWEFYSKSVKEKLRKAIYRMKRIKNNKRYPFLNSIRGKER